MARTQGTEESRDQVRAGGGDSSGEDARWNDRPPATVSGRGTLCLSERFCNAKSEPSDGTCARSAERRNRRRRFLVAAFLGMTEESGQ